MAQLADALGLGPEFTYDGAVYRAAPIAPIHRGRFEVWLERQAWEGVQRSKAWVDRDTFAIACRELGVAIGAQELGYASARYREALRSYAGIRYILSLLVKRQAPEGEQPVDEEWVGKWMDADMENSIRIYNLVMAEPTNGKPAG